MIYYPLETLLRAGIKEVFIVTAPEHAGDFLRLLGSGKDFDARFTYEIQDEPKGLAHGLALAESFADEEPIAFILGDNIFENDFTEEIKSFDSGAVIFAKEVDDPRRFGVVEFDESGKVLSIEEKPAEPKSKFAQPGLYIYDKNVFDYIRTIKPSPRGELEITDLNKVYLEKGELRARVVKGEWLDAGTFESLFKAAEFMRNKEHGREDK